MTKKEITEARRLFGLFPSTRANTHGLKVLDALEEAHREIADLQTRLCNRMGCAHAGAHPLYPFHLPGCPCEQLATLKESTTYFFEPAS